MSASRSNRPRARRFDDEDWQPSTRPVAPPPDEPVADEATLEPNWSTYLDATRGPMPVPGWLVTDPRAVDDDLGVLKTGKEADVSLLRRAAPDGADCLLAVKRYRSAEHRLFHRDAGYLEGRRVRKSREMRAMATRTAFGKDLIAQQWAAAEFAGLARLWLAGAPVPYPVQLDGTEMMMEFIGTSDGVAAPRLAQVATTRGEARDLFRQMVAALRMLADAGYAHGDLSAYNVLVHDGRLILIDLPQAVDVVGNPQGFEFLRRDCRNICTWFAGRDVDADADDLARDLAARITDPSGTRPPGV
ncbi:MAG: serine protein kinase RIO [Ilumatobacteraceae bacterium]